MKNYLRQYLKEKPFFYVFIRPKEAELFSRFLPFKKPVLDYGCGDGFFAKTLIPKGLIDVGVDINKAELAKTQRHNIYGKSEFYNQKKLPFQTSFFTTVISNCVLEHVDNLEHDLKEINRVLKKRGTFLCSVMTDKWEYYQLGKKYFGEPYRLWFKKKQKHPNLLSQSLWDDKFKTAGFKIKKRIGYLDSKTANYLEIFHFFSIGSLISYKFFGKWVLFPQKSCLFPMRKFLDKFSMELDPKRSAAIFYVLEK